MMPAASRLYGTCAFVEHRDVVSVLLGQVIGSVHDVLGDHQVASARQVEDIPGWFASHGSLVRGRVVGAGYVPGRPVWPG